MKCHDVQRMISGFIEEKLTDEQLEEIVQLPNVPQVTAYLL